jgi:ferritin-like metal-binding protein YciE
MPKTEKARELLMHGLKDIYDAEHTFAQALGTMAAKAKDRTLADGFRRHREVTQGQVRRLEKCFEEMGMRPEREECAGAQGLVEEYETFVRKERPDASALDVFAAGAALKVEHYEIAAYASMIDLALRLDMDDCARLLNESLKEEEATAAELEMSSRKLGAELTGSSAGLRGAIDTLRSGSRSGGLTAVGRAVRGQASGALDRLERRGRRAASKRRSPAKKAASRSRSTGSRRTATTRNGRRPARGRSTASRRASSSRTSARRPASRTTARKSSARRSTATRRRTTRSRSR